LPLHRIPTPTHRDSKVELAVANVFHPGSVRLEGWWSSMRCPHHEDEVR